MDKVQSFASSAGSLGELLYVLFGACSADSGVHMGMDMAV